MTDVGDLIALLAEKRELFLACERATNEMCVCPAEELEFFSEQRQETIDGACALDERIEALCGVEEEVRTALRCSCDRQGLSSRLGALYDASLSVKAVANRILQNEDTVRERIELEKARLLSKIEEINNSGSAIAGRYGKSVGMGVSRPLAIQIAKKI